MESWNREKLYQEIWEEPVTKVAGRYGVSDVMVAKVCRKLSIPLPGRGFWARKAAGQALKKAPLPKLKEVPVIHRNKAVGDAAPRGSQPPTPEPTDTEYIRIREVESRSISIDAFERQHKLVILAENRLSGAKADRDGILQPRGSGPILDLRVSAGTLDRALKIMNAILLTLEGQKFPMSVDGGPHGTKATIFGHPIEFALVEKVEVTGRREVQEYSWKQTTIVDHAPTGRLELRMGNFTYGPKLRDKKAVKLDTLIAQCVGGLMRLGRDAAISAEVKRLREIKERERQIELWELSKQIREEEEKVKQLDGWVNGWLRAKNVRSFATALETLWGENREDLSDGSPKRRRLDWMRQYADWLDPLVKSPPSVLDRKHEVRF